MEKGTAGFTRRDIVREGISKNENAAKVMLKRAVDAKIIKVNEEDHSRRRRYYHASVIADVMADFYTQNVTERPTGPARRAMQALELATYDWIESNILQMLPGSPQYIHNMHFRLKLSDKWLASGLYSSLSGEPAKGNRAKRFEKYLSGHFVEGQNRPAAGHLVEFLIYPNGTVVINTSTSRAPHRIETPEDLDALNQWLGRIEQALADVLSCRHSDMVPPVREWILTRCDLNIDIEVPHELQLYGPNLQWKYYGHLFRLYVKSMGDRTVARPEISPSPKEPVTESLAKVFTLAGHEKRLTLHDDQIMEMKGQILSLQKQVAELERRAQT
ncbi:hypothetical protein [Candidatus Nitrososphaera gargensis]|uniref:hypothetical protein n=1 Tax=Candidatus Nitrososphaera gargensis TaxID=497727 RepID=UPI0011E5404F|nr:hypothetical protein [Candidatus Nitrososphaera gargensis]